MLAVGQDVKDGPLGEWIRMFSARVEPGFSEGGSVADDYRIPGLAPYQAVERYANVRRPGQKLATLVQHT